ncbi:hypothetical protein HOK51_07680 [Candidatus Woesearchaeota archaeon]|nr:hypothetical protein [Candidatus Woesearchaeota archaeon]MBT6519704.1 hypothetical protein [Candidatus Woesearchaeota archaeon]
MNQTQTTQTNLTQNNFALKKLQGIKPKGVKVKQDNSKLSRLVSLCDVVNSQFSNLNIAGYLPIFDYVKEKLNKLVFDESDLITFINARFNHDQDPLLTGVYSGALLDVLSSRNKENNLKTNIFLDGGHNRFDYLFAFANNVDDIILKNLKGDHIGNGIGSFGGKANNLFAENIEGSYLFNGVGMHEGFVNMVYANNVAGFGTLHSIASSHGTVKSCIGINILGDRSLASVAFNCGKCDLIYCDTVRGNYLFMSSAGISGKIKNLICKNIEGKNVFDLVGSDRGSVGLAYVNGFTGTPSHTVYTDSGIGLLAVENTVKSSRRDSDVIIAKGFLKDINSLFKYSDAINCRKEKAPEKYKKLVEKFKISQIRTIVDQMSYKDIDDLVIKSHQINAVYDTLEEVLTR